MSHKKAIGAPANLDSPMSGHPPVKGLTSAPGTYSRHHNLGPAGETGGLPLKFFDESVKPGIQPVDNAMYVTPTKRSKR